MGLFSRKKDKNDTDSSNLGSDEWTKKRNRELWEELLKQGIIVSKDRGKTGEILAFGSRKSFSRDDFINAKDVSVSLDINNIRLLYGLVVKKAFESEKNRWKSLKDCYNEIAMLGRDIASIQTAMAERQTQRSIAEINGRIAAFDNSPGQRKMNDLAQQQARELARKYGSPNPNGSQKVSSSGKQSETVQDKPQDPEALLAWYREKNGIRAADERTPLQWAMKIVNAKKAIERDEEDINKKIELYDKEHKFGAISAVANWYVGRRNGSKIDPEDEKGAQLICDMLDIIHKRKPEVKEKWHAFYIQYGMDPDKYIETYGYGKTDAQSQSDKPPARPR